MTEVTPPYYAASVQATTYTVKGHNFHLLEGLPIKGCMSSNNNAPTMYRYYSYAGLQYNVQIVDDTTMVMTQRLSHAESEPTYLGCIVSEDGEVIYWRNTTNPLP